MKREWSPEDLANHWSLLFEELELLTGRTDIAKLGFSVLLKFFHIEYRFPERQQEVPVPAIEYVAKQIGEPSSLWHRYDLAGRSARRHRAQIRELLGFAETSAESIEEARAWLKHEILPQDPHLERASLALSGHLKARRIEVPPPAHARRLAEEALAELHREISSSIVAKLPDSTRRRLEALLIPTPASDDASEPTDTAPIHKLRADPGQTSVESILEEISKLVLLRSIELPADLFSGYSNRFLAAFRQRVFVSATFELKRHPEPLRLTLLSAFVYLRSREVTDSLVDLLNSLVHRMGTHAEKKVETEFTENIKRVAGKTGILFRIADAAVENPDGIVREVIFPVASESLLKALVEEWKASGPAYQQKVRKVMKQSYSFHYRRALPRMMEMLEFRSNNETHRPVLIAVALVKKYMTSKVQWYPETETIPIEDIVRAGWEDGVIETREDGSKRVNRFAYELCVLQALRERLRCKEIWVVGADRYRNPEEDLPKDFDEKRQTYYEELSLPHEAQGFIDQLKSEMHSALSLFNENLPRNEFVKLLERRGGWISLSPLKPQSEPEEFALMKRELADRWPMTSLLDILKEADLSVDFTGRFRSPTAYERLDRSLLQQRLLLCLYGLGTNTGIKRMTSSMIGVSYKDLLYTKRRFINKEYLRAAIAAVTNETFNVRRQDIWGEATTSCASDSKHFGAWDQNLMTEWHVRYGGRGVMIYWHVEKNSACIHSQLKRCSSSEVAAMIEGVLHHCTDMEVTKQYVDSHGQSDVAFGFCSLLGFELLPRLKRIHTQKLYRPEAGRPHDYAQLKPVLARAIDWELIRQQYDQMVKYATALRLGTAETESILRRFTRTTIQHPTYQAICELGKAKKTIFLCHYLRDESLRREIQEGLNVIERWNGVNDFIFFGRGGEFMTNDREEREISMLCLHLLQSSLVYINTLMIQEILTAPDRKFSLELGSKAPLTPLVHLHVNPYGIFRLDMSTRLKLAGLLSPRL